MIQDIIKGMKLGIKPFFYFNLALGVFPLYYLMDVNVFVLIHVFLIYIGYFMMGILIVNHLRARGFL